MSGAEIENMIQLVNNEISQTSQFLMEIVEGLPHNHPLQKISLRMETLMNKFDVLSKIVIEETKAAEDLKKTALTSSLATNNLLFELKQKLALE